MGPWSRSFVAAVAGNADNPELEVEALRVDPGEVWAIIEACEVTLTAHVIPARIWASMAAMRKAWANWSKQWRAASSRCTWSICCKKTG
jgi:hypothetical protein